jgi:hypothetical protein
LGATSCSRYCPTPATGPYADAHVSMTNKHFIAVDANGLPLLAEAFYYFFAP